MDLDYAVQCLRGLFPHADTRFVKLIAEMCALHEHKIQDYGPVNSGNLVAATEFGLPAWLGVLLRMNDKWSRIKHFAKYRSLTNESFADSLLDLANYSLLCLILYRSQQGEGGESTCVIEKRVVSSPCSSSQGDVHEHEDQGSASGVLSKKPRQDNCEGKEVARGASPSRTDCTSQVRAEEEEYVLRDLTDLTLGPSDGYAGSKPYWFRPTIDKALAEYDSRWAK